MISIMGRDKKAEECLSMVLLHGLGDPHLEKNIDLHILKDVLQKCKQIQLN
jgi:3-dehydroquinate synthetase